MRYIILLFALVSSLYAQKIDVQGHRGARGIFPENTIPAFIYALDQGVTTLELDVVITKDGQVLVSHEPWLSHEICLDPAGQEISKKEEKSQNIYFLNYEQIKQFDCGFKGNDRFPEQIKMTASKPLLSDVIKATERHIKGITRKEINYNIEIKSTPEGDNLFHPGVDGFSDMVYKVINDYLPWERVTIQSFDFRVLRYWHNHYPEVSLVVLIENLKSPKQNIAQLGFTPQVYSPNYKLLSKKQIDNIHELGMKVIPWTVNIQEDMQNLVDIGVDGIITDYPNRASEIGLCALEVQE